MRTHAFSRRKMLQIAMASPLVALSGVEAAKGSVTPSIVPKPEPKPIGPPEVWVDELAYFKNLNWYAGRLKGEVDLTCKYVTMSIVVEEAPKTDPSNGNFLLTTAAYRFDTDGFTTNIPDTKVILDANSYRVVGFQVTNEDLFVLNTDRDFNIGGVRTKLGPLCKEVSLAQLSGFDFMSEPRGYKPLYRFVNRLVEYHAPPDLNNVVFGGHSHRLFQRT